MALSRTTTGAEKRRTRRRLGDRAVFVVATLITLSV